MPPAHQPAHLLDQQAQLPTGHRNAKTTGRSLARTKDTLANFRIEGTSRANQTCTGTDDPTVPPLYRQAQVSHRNVAATTSPHGPAKESLAQFRIRATWQQPTGGQGFRRRDQRAAEEIVETSASALTPNRGLAAESSLRPCKGRQKPPGKRPPPRRRHSST